VKSVEQEIVNRTTVKVIKDAKKRILKSRENRQNLFSTTILRTGGENWRFDFIGWCNNFDLSKPLEKITRFNKPMILA
jgi:hypothetical protein